MTSATLRSVRRSRPWGLLAILMLAPAHSASAQIGLGGYGGFGVYGGYGAFGAVGGVGGLNVGGYGGEFGGYPLDGAINGYNAGYGNTFGLGLVPPAYVGTGTAGLGPVGIGGINPLFGLGLSPLAIHNAVAEQALRQPPGRGPNMPPGANGGAVRMSLYPPNTPVTAARPGAPALNPARRPPGAR